MSECLTDDEIASIYATWEARSGSTHAQLIADCYALGRHRALAAASAFPVPAEPGETYCVFCEKLGHLSSDCHSTVAVNTPRARELMRLANIASDAAAHPSEVEKNAARYAWLAERLRWASVSVDFGRDSVYREHRIVWHDERGWNEARGDGLDAAIDAAMVAALAAQKEDGK